jgi:hypothetical protein
MKKIAEVVTGTLLVDEREICNIRSSTTVEV